MVDATTAAALGKLMTPLLKEVVHGAKKIGVRGLQRWDARTFPSRIGARIKSIENVRTIWKPEAISLLQFFHPPKIILDGKPTIANKLSDIPGQAVVLEGIVGQGKSILLRSLAVQEVLSNEGKRIPIFIELKDLNSKLDLTQAVYRRLASYDIDVDDETLDYLMDSGKMALLLDGFDEVEEALVKTTYLDIEDLVLRHPSLQVIVTSRPGRDIQKSSLFESISVASLSFADFAPFLAKLGVSSEKSVALRAAIRNSPSKISSLITTPLMLTLVVMVYEAESQIPETLPEFFSRLFQTVFTRHDHLKAAFSRKHHSGLSEKALQELFENFCFMTIQCGYGRTLERAQFDEVYQLALDHSDSVCDCENFKLDIIKVACLMLEDGIDSITFLHKSILEYFAAAFVKRLSEENAILFYTAAIDRGKEWEEVLRFLKATDSFRYSKYYLLPAIETERSRLGPMGEHDEATVVKVITSIHPDLGVYYKAGDDGELVVSAYGGFTDRSAETLVDLGKFLMPALSEMGKSMLNFTDLSQNFLIDTSAPLTHHGVHVPLASLAKRFDAKPLLSAMGMYQSALERLASEAREVVSKEQRKSLIFGRRGKAVI